MYTLDPDFHCVRTGSPEVVQEALADLKKKSYNFNLLPYPASPVFDCAAYLNKRSTFYAEKRNSVFTSCFLLLNFYVYFDFLIFFFAKCCLLLCRNWYWHHLFSFITLFFYLLLLISYFLLLIYNKFYFQFLISFFAKCSLFLLRDWYWHHKPHEMNCTAQYWRFSNFLGLTFDEFCLVYILLILSYTESSFNLTN